MDGERDQYEERLREVFQSFDGSGLGSLCSEELTNLCRALQLEENTLNALVHALLQEQLGARVDFEQFKDALILVLSSTNTDDPQKCPEQADSSEVQPRFVKGSKRYGRRSAPEFIHANTDAHTQAEDENDENAQEGDDRTVPRKRERWNVDLSISEEFEAEGQLHLWNPDEPSTPLSTALPPSDLEERLQNACHQLSLPINGTATLQQLHTLCQHIGIELGEDLVQCADGSTMNVQEFVSYIINHSKPPTPSASTPYRQLKRHHSTQFDESGRRVSSALSSTIGLRLFSVLDDGSGHVPVETLLYRWMEEGVDNSSEILQALDFNLEDKVNLSELTVALENELLSTKNSIHQAALVSFRAEIRHLMECVDLERREKEKIRFDLEKAEKLKSQLASEVDEHHASIERNNELNLRKLEQEYKESMTALKAELSREVELVQQQANQQREELEQEVGKMKEDENFLREHLALTVKENGRLEAELIDSTEKLVEAENHINKLQKNLDGVLKERFDDLDPDSAEFYQQENRLRQLRRNYEEQCRELQDRIDELEAQLEECQAFGHAPSTHPGQSLSEELANKSPEPGSQKEPQNMSLEPPVNMSLETEMLMEQHQREIESIRALVYEEQRSAEEERSFLSLQHQQEMQVLREEMMAVELERVHTLEKELSALRELHQREINSLTQEAQDARSHVEQLEEQVEDLKEKQTAYEEQIGGHEEEISLMEFKHQEMLETCLQEQRERLQAEKEKQEQVLTEQWKQEQECLQRRHEEVQQKKEQECIELERRLREEWEQEREELERSSKEELQAILEERERKLREEWEQKREELERSSKEELQAILEERERKLREEWEQERQELEKSSEAALQAMLEERERKLREEWEQERQELEVVSKEALQAVLEERMESERRLRQQWDEEHTLLEKEHHAVLQQHLEKERERLHAQQEERESMMMEHYARERTQLEKQHEEALQSCLEQERERLQAEIEEQERRWQKVLKEEQSRMEEAHREAMLELSAKHSEERERLGSLLENLRTDIAQERRELEKQFSQRLKEVETRFHGDQEAVSERFQLDVCKLEQFYQSEIQALKEQHAADHAHWEEESEAATQEAEQQRKLLKELLDFKREGLKMEHARDIKALTDKNLQLQAELETFMSASQSKEIELSHQLNELHKHLQENMEVKNRLLTQAERKATELEAMLQQAVDDFIQERVELQKSLSALESRLGDALSLSESMELKNRIREGEELLRQAAEDFRNERLELEEKLKESLSLVMAKEEERVALLAENDTLALRVVQLEEMLLVLTGAELSREPCIASAAETSADTKTEDAKETCRNLTVELLGELTQETCKELPEESDPKQHIDEESTVNKQESYHTLNEEEHSFTNKNLGSVCDFTSNTSEMHFDVRLSCVEGDLVEVASDEEANVVNEPDNTELSVNTLEIRLPEVQVTEVFTSDSCEDSKPLSIDMVHVESTSIDTGSSDSLTEDEGNNKLKHAIEQSVEENVIDTNVDNDGPDDFALSKELQNAESNHTEGQEPVDCMVLDSDLAKLENIKPKTTVEVQGCEDTLEMAECKTICEVASETTESLDHGKHEDWIVNIPHVEDHPSEEVGTSYIQESLQHYESTGTENTNYKAEPEMNEPKDAVSIANLEHHIRALAGDVCALSADMEGDNVADVRSMCMQEILDLQEIVTQYTRAAERAGLQLQDLGEGQNITRPYVLPKTCELEAPLVTDLEPTRLKNCYERSICENVQLVECNRKLERRVKSLEAKMYTFQDFHKQQASVLENATQLRVENSRLKALLQNLQEQDERQQWDSDLSDSSNDSFTDLNAHLKEKIAQVAEQVFLSMELEKQNSRLRRELADLQGSSLRIHEQMQERRSEVCRLAKENLVLRHKISAVREEELRENQENLRLQHMKQGKRTAQALRRQLSEPRRLGQQLEENALFQLNAEHALRQAGQEVTRHHEHSPAIEKSGFQLFDQEDFVSRTEKELLRAELNRCIEKVMSLESSLQALTQQNAHLKSDLRLTQQERDALKQEVISLHKQLQSANEKLLEVSVVSAGQQQGRRMWAELSGLMEAEHASLMDENQRLMRQMSEMSSELQTAQEQICQLEALSLKQRGLVKNADQEKSALKREIEALYSHLKSTRNKAQLAAVLPSSPLQLPGEQRGQHHSDGSDFNTQDDRELALLHMEKKLREVELTLRNLKLLLQEKVSQLKDQLTRNSEADVLIKDLYVENAQLLKALEKTEQRQKVAEKKNFLLEEKISSLNKIVRDLGPSPLTPAPFHFTRS